MFLTRERDYAMRVVRALANLEKKSVKTICELEHVPLDFAYKILKKLERAGIVESTRGTRGGYQLAKKPNNITMFDVLYSVDDNLFINECLKPDADCPNHAEGKRCRVHEELIGIQSVIFSMLKSKTLDLL